MGSSMVLGGETPSRDPKVPATKNRVTWTPESPNLVRQHWETSTDLGKTWTTAFEGVAIYTDRGKGDLTATWWDSRGTTHPIKASVAENAMTSYWGESGRSVYTLLPSGELEVVDSVKGPDGAWGEFARAKLKKK